jgi:uncharacterized membrane protein YccC
MNPDGPGPVATRRSTGPANRPMIARVHAASLDRFVLKSALRAAIVVPLAFAFSLEVIGDKQVALFAAFGSMALLVFVDFGGAPRARLRAYLLLVVAGALLITLGTLCSHTTWLATVVMGVVAFAVLFAGVLDAYVAAAYAAALLTFVLPVMVPAAASAIPMRLEGWGLAGALCIPATLLLWPGRARNAVRQDAAEAARALAGLVEARSTGDRAAGDAAADVAHVAIVGVRTRFVSMAQRPSGTAGPTAALARLIDGLGWLHRAANRVPAFASGAAPCPAERAEIETSASAALRSVAAELESGPSQAAFDLERLRAAHEVFGRAQLAHFRQLEPGRDEAEATAELDEAYRLRQLSLGTLQVGEDALDACERRAGAMSLAALRGRVAAIGRLARTHASSRSVWMRNSLRAAVGLSLAVLIGRVTDLEHAFWIVLGTLSVLRSTALSTSVTVASALIGTLVGIIVGGLIVVAVGGDQGALWVVLPFAVLLAGYTPQAISFAAGQASFTIVVLVLFNLLQPAGWRVGLVRVEDVAIGAGVSLVVGALVWPHGATAILRRSMGAAYVAAAEYLDTTITALLGYGEPAQHDLAARRALDTAQLLDTAVRDDLASRSYPRGRLDDLTVLSSGANRVRRVGRMLEDAHSFSRLAPIGDELPRLAEARDAFDAERHARCAWYEALGTAISEGEPSPPAEGEGSPQAASEAMRSVVLEHAAGGGDLQPGLAIAWAHRHLDALSALEPMLTSALRRIHERDEAAVERDDPMELTRAPVAEAVKP